MKIKVLYILFALPLLWWSCSKDFGTTEVTYNKAIAIYEDLNEIRNTPLVEGLREISDPGKVFVSDEFLLIGEERKGIHVLDNSDPTHPAHVSFLNVPGNKEFFVADGFIYAESYYDMIKIDISDINSPKITGRVENYFESTQLNGQGDAVIGFRYEIVTEEVEDDDQSIWNSIYNYDEVLYDYNRSVIPHSAVPASFAGSSNKAIGSVNRITKAKGHVYAVNNERISVISDNNLRLIKSFYIASRMETIYPTSDYLFIGGTNSVEIFSIVDPSDPFHAGSFWHPTSCDPVYPLEDVAYLTLRTGDEDCPGDINSLVTLDISNVSASSIVQQIEMESPYGLTLINDKLYVGEGEYGLKIFDATDRYNLHLLKYDSSLPAYDIIQHPSRSDIVLIAGPQGFGQYDVNGDDEFSLLSWIAY
tara:strand:+ start:173 stop:1429 length:1257 start_codon:yes stop_codon:yes gene_type:complete